MLGIINDILDFSKMEADKLVIESIDFNLENVLNNVSHMISTKTEEKGLEFLFNNGINVPRHLISDPLRIGQILTNLCSNAVKFTEHGEIIISIKVMETSGDEAILKFCVKDTGIGLTKKQISMLFQAFNQADTSTTRKFGGTGLGLTISKRLSELLDGTIGVESEYGKGSTFWFTAKLGISDNPKTICFSGDDFQGKRALVVDDNPAARESLTSHLKIMGSSADTADNGYINRY